MKEEIREFTQKVLDFKTEFKDKAPFEFKLNDNLETVEDSFKILDEYEEKLSKLKDESVKYNDLENLFELEQTKYKSLKECKTDIKKLWMMWKHIEQVL